MASFRQRYTRIIVEAGRQYGEHRFGPRAQAIAYNVLLSLIPVLATAVAFLGFVLRDDELRSRFTEALIRWLAVTTGNTGFIRDTMDVVAASSRTVGPLSLLLALWTIGRAVGVVRLALEDAWGEDARAPFLHRRMREAAIIGTVVALLVASTMATAVIAAVIARGSGVLGLDASWLPPLATGWGVVLALGLSATAFVLTYRFVPARGQCWVAALAGGIPAGLAFEGLRLGFTVVVTRFAGLNPVYGALSSVFLFLAWANVAASILLLGAEVTVVWQQSDGGRTLEPVRVRLRRLLPRVPLPHLPPARRRHNAKAPDGGIAPLLPSQHELPGHGRDA
jgi:membrane protein